MFFQEEFELETVVFCITWLPLIFIFICIFPERIQGNRYEEKMKNICKEKEIKEDSDEHFLSTLDSYEMC